MVCVCIINESSVSILSDNNVILSKIKPIKFYTWPDEYEKVVSFFLVQTDRNTRG